MKRPAVTLGILFTGMSLVPAASACTSTRDVVAALKGMHSRPAVTAIRHRGDFNATSPEMSLAALRNSYQLCRAGIEVDIRSTKDGQLVLFHDERIGRMMEPSYVPEAATNNLNNGLLKEYRLSELKEKNLLNVGRASSGQKIPTLDEVLEDYIRQNAQSLIYLDFKDAADVPQAARILSEVQRQNPGIDMYQSIVFKIGMNAYPTWASWVQEYDKLHLQKRPLVQVQISSRIADEMGAWISIPDSVTSYAVEPDVLSIEVSMKDSSGYLSTRPRAAEFGSSSVLFRTPTNLSMSNARVGSMAMVTEVVRFHRKPIAQFVPIPDWVLWRKEDSSWNGYWTTELRNLNLNHVRFPSTITPMHGFFNNDSRCCYALVDRVDPNYEEFDQRILLPWMEDIGATVLTADDTDNVNLYFMAKGKYLDLGEITRPRAAMNSAIDLTDIRVPVRFLISKDRLMKIWEHIQSE